MLQPRLVTDPNRNRTAAAFDALGMVVATAVMGKEGENLGDLLEDFDADPPLADLQAFIADPHARAATLLGKATTRIVYDLGRYQRAGQPPFAATLARETHFHDPGGAQTRIQISFSYSDGFGREIQKKIQAEAGDAPQRQAHVPLPTGDIRPGDLVRDAQGRLVRGNTPRRWVGTGRTVFNNKGKPVRQYEPFFSATHLYEPEREMTDTGVSPVLFYDPVGRVVATLHPNHTYEKVVFDPWQQTTYDVNDTVVASAAQTGDPRTDEDIEGYVREYFKTQPNTWQTWHAQRIGNQLGAAERDAARKAAAHADTPTVAHLDALGRPFLTLAHNGPDPAQPGKHLLFATRVELDIEGNHARGQRRQRSRRHALRLRHARQPHPPGQHGGGRALDAERRGGQSHPRLGQPPLPAPHDLRRAAPPHWPVRHRERRWSAWPSVPSTAKARAMRANHRTRVHKVFDGAGIVDQHRLRLQGQPARGPARPAAQTTSRRWTGCRTRPLTTAASPAAPPTTRSTARLNATSPDNSVYRPTYNEANLLERMDVNLRGAASCHAPSSPTSTTTPRASAKRIEYGNAVFTEYDLRQGSPTGSFVSRRRDRPFPCGSRTVVQDLRYTYDPAGNITHIEDDADIQTSSSSTTGGSSRAPIMSTTRSTA